MNNTVLKNIAFAASGALFGALGAYVATKKVLSEQFEEELKNYKDSDTLEVKKLKEESYDLRKRIDIYEQAGLSFETAKAMAEANKALSAKKEEEIMRPDEMLAAKKVNYANIAKQEKNDISDKENEVETNVENFTPSKRVKDEEPYLISVDQFASERDDFRKVSCTFYTEDCVLCETSHNEKIEIKHVGQENIDMLLNSDIDIMYVRNEYLSIDYEIDKYEGSYAYEVLGEESLNE